MKKIVLIFGLIAGLISVSWAVFAINICYNKQTFEGNVWLGYGSMIVAFSFIFVGIKNYRDKYNGGVITFGKAFKIGFLIALIASTIYVLVWMIDFYVFIPDFMDKYVAHALAQAKAKGATAAQLTEQKASMATYTSMYKSPVGVMLLTYMEILPVGLVIALIAALILKRRNPRTPALETA